MKCFLTILSCVISTLCFCQSKTVIERVIVDSGKYEFKLQAKKDTPDYSKAYRILTSQVRQKPGNAELHYFLGYTIDRLNTPDGGKMYQTTREMSIRASEEFETVNRLEPVYKGELFTLDPYSKLTAIWGALAGAYLYRKQPDSAKWAFAEGKRRGGFGEPFLTFNRQLLNSCAANAILLTEGDDVTFPVWYLQMMEQYRTDITPVDVSLINAPWYVKYLKDRQQVKISYSDAAIDTIDYQRWQPQPVWVTDAKDTTRKFSWELRPTYMENYILRGNKVLLDILQQQFYTRPFYFLSNSDTTTNLFLTDHLVDEGLVVRVSERLVEDEKDTVLICKNLQHYTLQNLTADDIKHSRNAIHLLNNFRWAYYSNIVHLLSLSKYRLAERLVKEMTEKFSKDKLPFASPEQEQYFDALFSEINRNLR